MINYYTILHFKSEEEATDKEVGKRVETEIARLTKLKEDVQYKLLNAKTENEKKKIRMEINALENSIQLVFDAWRATGTENARKHYKELRDKIKNQNFEPVPIPTQEQLSEGFRKLTQLANKMNESRDIDTKGLVDKIWEKTKKSKTVIGDKEEER